ncbi:MAG: hypothetical protein ACE5K0_01335 [Candidatus Methanofastidiosia archaeon]
MHILLEAKEKYLARLEDDLKRLRSEVILPMQITWELNTHSENSWNHAEFISDRETNRQTIRFYDRYFKVKN